DSQPPSTSIAIASGNGSHRRRSSDMVRTSVQINDIDAAIAPPRLFGMPRDRRPLLAVADGSDLRIGHALQCQRPAYRLRAALAQTDVVFARAALVGIALQAHADRWVRDQIVRMGLDQR